MPPERDARGSHLSEPVKAVLVEGHKPIPAFLVPPPQGMEKGGALAPIPDGPQPPCKFYYKQNCVELAPIPWRLLDFMWKHRVALIDEAFEAVWEHENQRSPDALDAAKRRVNAALLKINASMVITEKSGSIMLE